MAPSQSGAEFNLALGDLSYGGLTPETAWCDYVKSMVGQTHPFELIAGNHEDDGPSGNNINGYVQCLPHRIDNITGTYGKEYYFDYPSVAPLARIISISPDLTFTGEGTYSYASGSTHYNWTSSAIDGARAAGIPWVIVAMHKDCISVGEKSCDIGEALFNLLISKKVDLVLQAHDHTYQRSKQLAQNVSCATVPSGTFNAACVADDGSDDMYTKTAGTVFAIVGNGGNGLYNVSSSDSEAGYFAKLSGLNNNPTWGFLQVRVDLDRLIAQLVPAVGTFADNFTIVNSGIPTVTPAPPTPTAVVSPSPTPGQNGSLTFVKQVISASDDAEEAISNGSVDLASSDLELGADGSTVQIVGTRFTNIAVPRGAIITNAYVEFEVDETSTVSTSLSIQGEASSNALAYAGTTRNISNRPKTTAQVVWNQVPSWATVDTKQQTPNISEVIQEIVNRPSWISGNAIAVMIQGTGRRTAEAYDGEIPAAAKLVITYTTGPTATPTPTPTIDPNPPTVTPTPTFVPTNTPSPTSATQIMSFNPVADTYVQSTAASTNFGTSTNFFVDASPVLISYLKFDLSSLAGLNITSAKFRIRVSDNSSSGTQTIKSVASTTWTETGTTYSNRPALGNTIASFVGSTKNTWYEITITPEVIVKRGQHMTIGINETSSDGVNFFSRESASKPVLVVTTN